MLRIGRVGRPHGVGGDFRVDQPTERPGLLEPGRRVVLEGRGPVEVEARKGTAERPIIRLAGIDDPSTVRGKAMLVARSEIDLDPDEWLVDDLIGCVVPGLGTVTDVWIGPSADGLVIDGGATVVPLVRDAVVRIDPDQGLIEVDPGFLGIPGGDLPGGHAGGSGRRA